MVRRNREESLKIEAIGGLLGLARRARGVVIGSRETRTALRTGRVVLVLLAGDGSPRDHERIGRIAEEEGVPARTVATREELGSRVGTGPVSVLGLTDPRLAREVRARLDEAEAKARGTEPGGTGGSECT